MSICPRCSKSFSSKSALNTHIKAICSDNPSVFSCEFCNSTFNRKTNLNVHLQTCSSKKQREMQNINDLLAQKTTECDDLKLQLEKSKAYNLRALAERDKQIAELKGKNKTLKKAVSEFKEMLSKTVNKAIDKASTVNNLNITTNNQTFNNLIVDNLQPITDELLKEISDKVSIMAIKSGSIGIANAVKPLLEDKIVKSDEARSTLAYNYKGVPKKDPKGLSLSTQIIESTSKKLEKFVDEILQYYDDKNDKGELVGDELDNSIAFKTYRKNMKTKRFKLEAKKLAKRIAKYAMSKAEFDSKFGITKNQEQKPDGLQLSDIPPGCQNYTYEGKDYTIARSETGEAIHLFRLKSTGEIMESDDSTDDDFSEESSDDM